MVRPDRRRRPSRRRSWRRRPNLRTRANWTRSNPRKSTSRQNRASFRWRSWPSEAAAWTPRRSSESLKACCLWLTNRLPSTSSTKRRGSTETASPKHLRRFLKAKPQRLTRAALETLAIIAYRQPVTRAEVEDIRGVDSAAVIKALLERRLVRILGKKEEIGRPILYGTSREFLEFFGLKDLASLPT